MASFVPSNSCHLQQLNSIYWCTYASRVSPLPLKGTSLALEVIYDWPLSSGLLHLDCTISPFCLCSASLQEVPFSAFCQWRIPTICLPVWGLPHQSQSHLNPLHSPLRSQYSYRALCISQLLDWRRHYSRQSCSATLAHPNTGMLVKQLLNPLYPNSNFHPSEGSWDAGRVTPFRTGDLHLAIRK